ncbi:hypothetical protein BDQ12DRAFT_724108 [Crucibulum laeve]|uniref:Rap-GAP domain-containing protein n=1 Tax=Crucibulum laeve TaxID=68775 RepID=A0A5C3LZ13_9AGAR|nr:hypothetical protein BDQ12DRAFT_724108 [Crucibulum laeve]
MSRQQQDAESHIRPRQRANTTSFPSFTWRKPRTDHPSASPGPVPPVIQQPLTLEALVEALTPPAVPSLTHARALASLLATHSPLPRSAILNPIVASLCDIESPVSVQAAGYDILSAYWENHEALALTTADRLSYFALFLGSSVSWMMELWEPRFKALRSLTRYGADVVGIERPVIDLLKWWVEGGFEGLLKLDVTMERSERAERERTIDVLVKFLGEILSKVENVARISEEAMADVLQFFAKLVDLSIRLPSNSVHENSSGQSTEGLANSNTPSKPPHAGHRRNHSSMSTSSVPSVISPPPTILPKYTSKHPAEIAISLYLDHLSSQMKTLPPVYLRSILPVLFRALAFCASPLPRLTVLPQPARKASLEERLTETLNLLFAGPYAATCMLILKEHLFPPKDTEDIANLPDMSSDEETVEIPQWYPFQKAIVTSLGAHRTLRDYIRRALSTRLARAYISRENTIGYSHAGAPSHMEMEADLMEKAWPKEDYTSSSGVGINGNGWDAGRLGKVLASSVEAWVDWTSNGIADIETENEWLQNKQREDKEKIMEEAAGILKDILQELDAREDERASLDEEEAGVVGETLTKLAAYILPMKNQDGSPLLIPLTQPTDAPTPLLRTITSLLARDHSTSINPLLSSILITIADHLTDSDTARLPVLMMEQHDLSPTSPDWLANWHSLLVNPVLLSTQRPLTRSAVIEALVFVYESVKDMTTYRAPLADLVVNYRDSLTSSEEQIASVEAVWKILADEVVLRTVESEDEQGAEDAFKIIELLDAASSESDSVEDSDYADTASILTTETSPSPPLPPLSASTAPSTIVSPILSRMQSEYHNLPRDKDKDTGLPSVMSILSSLTTGGNVSRAQSIQPTLTDDKQEESPSPPRSDRPSIPRVVSAVSALVSIFSQLSFTPFALEARNLRTAIKVFHLLLRIVEGGKSSRARLTALQFLMRLRADRDHKLYFVASGYDVDTLVVTLASLIHRVQDRCVMPAEERRTEGVDISDVRKARARLPERDGRQLSRGRGGGPSRSAASRSRSRAPVYVPPIPPPPSKPREALWHVPEALPFTIAEVDIPSEGLISYDPEGPGLRVVLPISQYLNALLTLLEKEQNWEILSYVLCHLPVQLANKHLFCGPKSRKAISRMLSTLCTGILSGELAFHVDRWPGGLKLRDAHGLAYHTLSVLVSYRPCFDLQQRHLLVEVFQAGLNGQASTIKCCLHALSLSAFELQSSMTKCLSRILEKLSQIMSNPDMAVHILGFLSIIGSLPPLYANFTESDFKMVFGVALQYLQHYNRLNASPTMSWALSQHVRILSYYVVYVWFLAVKLPDRPGHVQYITRQLLLANEGNGQVDGPTEVCFDWLARYTYASADPRPTTSTFSDIVMNPSAESRSETAVAEKTWILGNSVVTVRTLERSGWVEVLSRRPSGFSKFLCRLENVPLVGPGDVSPDLFSVPAGLIMEREPIMVMPDIFDIEESSDTTPSHLGENPKEMLALLSTKQSTEYDPPNPDPITGYVWSGTAPSQRRKHVSVDPSFLVLQLSPYPESINLQSVRMVADLAPLPKFIGSLDRIPVIDTHKVGIMYVAPGQNNEIDILRNSHGSPAYTRFLEGIGRLINLRGQVDVYAGGLDPDEDGEYAYAWWDDIGQILYHTATMMPNNAEDPQSNSKKRHIGNDFVRIIWNDSGLPYRFDTLATQFQFVNIVIEPHSLGAIAAFSNNLHENEYFKVTVQRAPGMTEFAPVGPFKLISAENLPLLVRQLSLLADWFASVFSHTQSDTLRVEIKTNWHTRLEAIRRFKNQIPVTQTGTATEGILGQEAFRDFTTSF